MTHVLRSAGVALAVVVATGCAGTPGSITSPTDAASAASSVTKTLQVAASRVECTGVSKQTCLQVRETSSAPWGLLYDAIIGFDYEPGFLYEIRVKEEPVANPPADASSIRRTLVSVLSKTPVSTSLAGPTWRLVSIEGRPVLAGVQVTAVFGDDSRVTGSGGCNRYTGRVTIEGDKLNTGAVASTRMFCGGAGVMEQEVAYFDALSKAAFFKVAGNELHLGPASGVTTLVFRLE